MSIAALSGVSNREAGLASGLITTSQQIGGGIGLAILTSVSTTRTNNLLASGVALPTALTDGFRLAFWVAAGLAALAFVATAVLLGPGKAAAVAVERAEPERTADDRQIAA